jgi:N-acetylglutamate synthase
VTEQPDEDSHRTPDPATLRAALVALRPPIWPDRIGPFRLQGDAGGGCVATMDDDALMDDPAGAIAAVAARMVQAGHTPRFRITEGQEAMDRALERAGYNTTAPGRIYLAPIARLGAAPPLPLTAFTAWPPLAIQHRIWAEAGGGEIPQAPKGPCTAILGRIGHRAAGVLLVACRAEIALLHGLAVRDVHRRSGVAQRMVAAAAHWAAGQGARWVAAEVTDGDGPALSLAASLSMAPAARYHYRVAG